MVYQRVTSVLHKITLLTLFYQICGTLSVIGGAFDWFFGIPLNSIESYVVALSQVTAIYLMMDHNESEHIKFLKWMNKYKCDWICYCCCRFMIVEQLNYLDPETATNRVNLEVDRNGKNKMQDSNPRESTQWETRNVSTDDYQIKTNGNEISIATTIIEETQTNE